MKRTNVLCRLLLLLLAIALPSFAEKVSTLPAPTGYIDDYAGVFSSQAKTEMEELSRELHDKTRAQVFVVTVNTPKATPSKPSPTTSLQSGRSAKKRQTAAS
jgi:uncharacterized protein